MHRREHHGGVLERGEKEQHMHVMEGDLLFSDEGYLRAT